MSEVLSPERRARYRTKLGRLGQQAFDDRLEALFDPGSWRYLNAAGADAAWELAVVTAEGRVNGIPCAAWATNFAVQDGTLGPAETADVVSLVEHATEKGLPVVALLQSNGARVADGHGALLGNAELFWAITRASGVVPQITACLGLCAGVPAYVAGLSDVVFMVEGGSHVFTTSPAVIKAATGRKVGLDELGGAAMHASTSGVCHRLVSSEETAIAEIRSLLDLLRRPVTEPKPAAVDAAALAAIVPAAPHVPYDVRKLLAGLVDGGAFFELHAGWGTTAVVGFGRLEGRTVGFVANQPSVRSGCIEVESARKASRFVQVCDSFGVPLVYVVDVPGIMVSPQQEQAGVLTAGATFFHAVDTEVPRVALVTRKCFGGAFVMLQARRAGGDRVLAYPQARIGVTGPEAAFAILHGKEALTHAEPQDFRREALAALREAPVEAEAALASGIVDAIVSPSETRAKLSAAIAEALAEGPRRRARPARRHPNLPF